jgi:hypothetical protein
VGIFDNFITKNTSDMDVVRSQLTRKAKEHNKKLPKGGKKITDNDIAREVVRRQNGWNRSGW